MAETNSQQTLPERGQHLLKVLVERFIADGEPVGSRTLARDSGLDLSPATIRNVIADLEDLGLVASPHTSAGRVPTVKGYRMFIDTLLTISPLRRKEIQKLRTELRLNTEPQELLGHASSLLSELTKMAGVVTLPRRDHMVLRQVEFLSLSGNRVLVILVSKDGEVQNRVIQTNRSYTRSQLEQAANYISQHGKGLELEVLRNRLVNEMDALRHSVTLEMQAVVEMAEKTFTSGDDEQADYVMSGQTNLMGFSELSSVDRLRSLFDAFGQKRDLLHLFDQCLEAKGVQIFIGEESGYSVLDQCSVVTAPYRVSGETVGVLGIIGPTRMAYHRVIPMVDVTARLLTAALNQR